MGGYPVLKKWLSYREHVILGRSLKPEEVREFRDIARRIAAILLFEPALDTNYQAVIANLFDWSTVARKPAALRMW
jgi:NAD(P)H-dependent FMN reductase